MLPKKNRFTRAEFDRLLADPTLSTVYNRIGTLKYISAAHRLAVVTSSKHAKRAVVRNTMRRRLYDRFRSVRTPLSAVLYVSKQSYTFDPEETRKLFDALIALVAHASTNRR